MILEVLTLFINSFHTYDHRVWRTGLPVRSAVLKPHAGRLVVGWVTTSESLLLYVFFFSSLFGVSVDYGKDVYHGLVRYFSLDTLPSIEYCLLR